MKLLTLTIDPNIETVTCPTALLKARLRIASRDILQISLHTELPVAFLETTPGDTEIDGDKLVRTANKVLIDDKLGLLGNVEYGRHVYGFSGNKKLKDCAGFNDLADTIATQIFTDDSTDTAFASADSDDKCVFLGERNKAPKMVLIDQKRGVGLRLTGDKTFLFDDGEDTTLHAFTDTKKIKAWLTKDETLVADQELALKGRFRSASRVNADKMIVTTSAGIFELDASNFGNKDGKIKVVNIFDDKGVNFVGFLAGSKDTAIYVDEYVDGDKKFTRVNYVATDRLPDAIKAGFLGGPAIAK